MDIHKMKGVTNFVILFLIASYCNLTYACSLTQNIVSLSGPVSYALKELNLQRDTSFLGASSYHLFLDDFKGKKLGGGIYISSKTFYEFKKSYKVFIDESFDLKNTLKKARKKISTITSVEEVISRSRDNFEFSLELLDNLLTMTKGCHDIVENLKVRVLRVKKKIDEMKLDKRIIFSLGDYKKDALIVANDLFVSSLKKIKNFKTYESEHAYSKFASQMKEKYKSYDHCTLKQVKEKLKIIRDEKQCLISGAGVLTPGLAQVWILEELLSFFSKSAK